MANLIKKEYYPISDRIGIELDINNNTVSLFEPENPATNKNEIRLFQTRFFKADWIKNLKDDLFFKTIKTNLIDTKNELMQFSGEASSFKKDLKEKPEFMEKTCLIEGCEQAYSEELMNEFERLISPFLTIEVRKQNDLLYKNSLDKINEEELNFYLKGIDDFEVLLSVDSLHKNYIDLEDIRVFQDYDFQVSKADDYQNQLNITEHTRFIAPFYKPPFQEQPLVGGKVRYLLNVKLYGNLTTYKGKVKR